MSKTKAKFILNPAYKHLMARTPLDIMKAMLELWRDSLVKALILIGLIMLLVHDVTDRQAQNDLLIREGQQTQGEVIRCRVDGHGSTLIIDYRYAVGDVVYKSSIETSGTSCTSYPNGGMFTVLYRPANPADSGFNGAVNSAITEWHKLIGILLATALSIVVLPGYNDQRYDLRRLEERDNIIQSQGTLLDGEIVEVDGGSHTAMVTVQYRFTTPRHTSLVGWTSAYRPDLKGRLPLAGTPIFVLYVSDSNHQAL